MMISTIAFLVFLVNDTIQNVNITDVIHAYNENPDYDVIYFDKDNQHEKVINKNKEILKKIKDEGHDLPYKNINIFEKTMLELSGKEREKEKPKKYTKEDIINDDNIEWLNDSILIINKDNSLHEIYKDLEFKNKMIYKAETKITFKNNSYQYIDIAKHNSTNDVMLICVAVMITCMAMIIKDNAITIEKKRKEWYNWLKLKTTI